MIKIGNLDRWDAIAEGEMLQFPGDKGRTVVLQVNAPRATELHVIRQDESKFLALVEGRTAVEFWIEGAFDLTVIGGDVFVYTADGAQIHSEAVDQATFTKMHERRRVSPEVAMMERAMRENMLRFMEMQQEEMDRRLSAYGRDNSSAPSAGATPAEPEPVGEWEPEPSPVNG